MMQPLKEALRWSSQAEDDLKFVKWLVEEKTFFDTPFQVFTMEDLGEAIEDVSGVFIIARDFLDSIREKILQ